MAIFGLSCLTLKAFLIVCPLVFLAGFVDSIAGGGALISLPAYIIAGIPIHFAVATNKLSASFGATTSAYLFIKNKLINFKLGIPSVIFAIIGSILGANLSMHVDDSIMVIVLWIVLPITAFAVLNKKIFHDNPNTDLKLDQRTFIIVMTVAFLIGIYDGFFGPGAGTFTIIAFNIFGKMSIANANVQTKLINLTTTVTALFVFLINNQVLIPLGIIAGLCNMLGSFLGAKLVMSKGSRITKPIILFILLILTIKIAGLSL